MRSPRWSGSTPPRSPSLTGEHKVKLVPFPDDLVTAARKQSNDVLGEIASRDAISGKVHASYLDFRARTAPWSRVSIEAVLRATGVGRAAPHTPLIPAQAGIQRWVPAFAGTSGEGKRIFSGPHARARR